jgi:hypothetical protein
MRERGEEDEEGITWGEEGEEEVGWGYWRVVYLFSSRVKVHQRNLLASPVLLKRMWPLLTPSFQDLHNKLRQQ